MNTQETILQLEGLKLKGMADCYKALQQMPVSEWPTLDQFVARMAESGKSVQKSETDRVVSKNQQVTL